MAEKADTFLSKLPAMFSGFVVWVCFKKTSYFRLDYMFLMQNNTV